MTPEQKEALQQAREQAKQEAKELKQWQDFIKRMEEKGAVVRD
jgi:hypothetical protein